MSSYQLMQKVKAFSIYPCCCTLYHLLQSYIQNMFDMTIGSCSAIKRYTQSFISDRIKLVKWWHNATAATSIQHNWSKAAHIFHKFLLFGWLIAILNRVRRLCVCTWGSNNCRHLVYNGLLAVACSYFIFAQ